MTESKEELKNLLMRVKEESEKTDLKLNIKKKKNNYVHGIWPHCVLLSQLCPTLYDSTDSNPPGSSVHGDSPGKNTEVGCLALLQGIFSIQGLNPDLPHCRWILYCLSHQGSPRMLDWIVYPFSRGSFQPRNRTGVSCIAGRFFTSCATREAHPPTSLPNTPAWKTCLHS